MLCRDGRFVHDGIEVTHPRLREAFRRGVRFAEAEGVFVVQLGVFRGQIEVEDTPFFVVAYDAATGSIELTDRSSEALEVATLAMDDDGVLRCRVKGRFPARFTQTGQAHLLDAVEPSGAGYALRAGRRRLAVPGLDPCA